MGIARTALQAVRKSRRAASFGLPNTSTDEANKPCCFAKFVPGINTMSPPLAGSMKMRFDSISALRCHWRPLYVGAYGVGGFVFSDLLRAITRGLKSAGRSGNCLGFGIAGYVVYRIWLFKKYRVYKLAPGFRVEEVARRLTSTDEKPVLVVDVRSHGYYDADSQRIKGSVRIEPNNLAEEVKNLPKDRDIYVYCT